MGHGAFMNAICDGRILEQQKAQPDGWAFCM
jgi:hypothetical protein